MSHLLLASGFSRKVVLISLTKTLFADASQLLNCDELNNPRAISLVDTIADMRNAMKDPVIKVVLVEAKHSSILHESGADIAFSIAAMQEMNYLDIHKYFDQMRLLASGGDFTFYCCSREAKTLPDGQIIQFEKYPWNKNDSVVFDDMPWHDKYYRSIILHFNYDGVHRRDYKNESKQMTMNTINARRELKRKLAAREHVFGGWVSYRGAAIAETFAKAR